MPKANNGWEWYGIEADAKLRKRHLEIRTNIARGKRRQHLAFGIALCAVLSAAAITMLVWLR